MPGNPRRANGSARTKLRARVAAEREPCHLCGYPIRYGAHHLDPRAFALDELVPVARGGNPLDPENVAPAHRCCNSWRGAKPVTRELKRSIRERYEREFAHKPCNTSRRWI